MATCAAGAVLAAALPAAAQVAPVQQGRALDANPMVGGGGANNPIPGYVPVNGNDIITGNVTGLGGWHGQTPYISPLEFRGGSGGVSNLNSFVRQSSGPLYRGTYIGGAQSYYQPTRITAGNSGDIAPGMLSNVPNAGMSATLAGPESISPTYSQRPLGAVGQRVELIPSSGSLPIRNFNTVGNQPPGPLNQETETNALFGLGVPAQPGLIVAPQPALRTELQRPQTKENAPPSETQPAPTDAGAQRQVQSVGGTDQRVLAQVKGSAGERPVERIAGQPSLTTEQLATNEVYQNLLTELRQQNPAAVSPRVAAATPTTPGTPQTPAGAATRPRGEADLITGLPRTPGQEPYQSVDPSKPNYRPQSLMNMQEATAQQTAALQAGREIKPLQTFVGTKATPFNELIAMAEAQMHRGRYLDAADTYQRAVLAQPTNPLAVAGRINAELGAGMYESAAYDLKFMFNRNPALVAVRYDLPAFLNPKRIDVITKDLTELAGKKGEETAAPLLLSYIYYQTGRRSELEATMADWAKRAPKDPWIGILRRAWLEEKAAPATQPTTEPAPK